ncbi:MAG TPA: alkaline phosphatase [Firmicutes bacterium]|nr:alkaline phosphatase [Bacillota bacterium]
MKRIAPRTLRWLTTLALVFFLALSAAAAPKQIAKNVILLIGDGMGAAERQLATYYAGQKLEMDRMPMAGLMTTESADSLVTDSAAAATAMATGFKTKNGMISVTPDGKPVPTVLERAKERGLATGLVATSTITHATPACFASHVASRASEASIADQYFEEGVDVLFGGGTDFFLPKAVGGARTDDRNLIEDFKAKGYLVALDAADLKDINRLPALGLFSEEGMQPEIDRKATNEPSLAEMTAKAIELLSQDKDGFFLMVEGSQIDWAGHANDPIYNITDTLAFDAAVAVARRFALRNPDTLVIVAADHETGGLSLGQGKNYFLKLDILRNQQYSGQFIAGLVGEDRSQVAEAMKDYAGIESLTSDELKTLTTEKKLDLAINKVMSDRAGLGWASYAHTAVPVPVTAEGANAELFGGVYDNTDFAKKMAEAMGLIL